MPCDSSERRQGRRPEPVSPRARLNLGVRPRASAVPSEPGARSAGRLARIDFRRAARARTWRTRLDSTSNGAPRKDLDVSSQPRARRALVLLAPLAFAHLLGSLACSSSAQPTSSAASNASATATTSFSSTSSGASSSVRRRCRRRRIGRREPAPHRRHDALGVDREHVGARAAGHRHEGRPRGRELRRARLERRGLLSRRLPHLRRSRHHVEPGELDPAPAEQQHRVEHVARDGRRRRGVPRVRFGGKNAGRRALEPSRLPREARRRGRELLRSRSHDRSHRGRRRLRPARDHDLERRSPAPLVRRGRRNCPDDLARHASQHRRREDVDEEHAPHERRPADLPEPRAQRAPKSDPTLPLSTSTTTLASRSGAATTAA